METKSNSLTLCFSRMGFIGAALSAMLLLPSLWEGPGMGLFAQNAGINATGNPPNAKALLDLDATGISPKTGLLIPRMTTAERNAITAPIPESLLIYNTTTQCYEGYNAATSTWVAFGCIGCQLPGAFTATAATNIAQTAFDANWTASSGATTYFLDVATDATFTAFVTGYNNLNVGNVTTYSVNTNLACATTYYYRVRAENSCGTSANSNTITAITSSCCSPGDVDNGDGTCTATFYPDADPEITSVDGGVNRQVDEFNGDTWATIHNSTGLFAYDNSTNGSVYLRRSLTSGWWTVSRAITIFNTTSLPDAATINSAILSVYGWDKGQGTSYSPSINVYSVTTANSTSLVTGDYLYTNFGSTAFSTTITYAGFSITGYNDFVLNASGISNISKTGVSKFGFREVGGDVNDVEQSTCTYSSLCYFFFYMSEQGIGYKPKLVVTYTP